MCTPARCRCLPTAKPFPPRCRHGTTRTLTPATVTTATGLPASPTHTSSTFRLQPRGRPGHRFHSQISVTSSRLRLLPASSSPFHAESSSSTYGPPVRFRLLSTPHRCDAVTFSYGDLAYPDTDFHRAVWVRLRAHWEPTLSAIFPAAASKRSRLKPLPPAALMRPVRRYFAVRTWIRCASTLTAISCGVCAPISMPTGARSADRCAA